MSWYVLIPMAVVGVILCVFRYGTVLCHDEQDEHRITCCEESGPIAAFNRQRRAPMPRVIRTSGWCDGRACSTFSMWRQCGCTDSIEYHKLPSTLRALHLRPQYNSDQLKPHTLPPQLTVLVMDCVKDVLNVALRPGVLPRTLRLLMLGDSVFQR